MGSSRKLPAGKAAAHPRPPRPAPILLVVRHDSDARSPWIEVYCKEHIDVGYASLPVTRSAGDDRLMDEYIELTVPKRFARLYLPGYVRAADQVRPIEASEMLYSLWRQDMAATIDRVGDDLRADREEAQAWTL